MHCCFHPRRHYLHKNSTWLIMQDATTHNSQMDTADIQNLGSRMEAIELILDTTVARTNQNTDHIQELHNHLEMALNKIDGLENRSRRYHFKIRGILEAIKNIPEIVQAFILELIPAIPPHRLELDRAHRALRPPRQDGLPRDVVVKARDHGD